ncbi:MAG: DivIVA domain-containing protein [Ornithinimicrobium sp.]
MTIVVVVLAVLAVGVVAAVVVSRSPVPGVEDAVTTQSYAGLAPGAVHPDDIRAASLDVAVRGYRMDQVDAVLERLADELETRDAEIDRLRRQEHRGHL